MKLKATLAIAVIACAFNVNASSATAATDTLDGVSIAQAVPGGDNGGSNGNTVGEDADMQDMMNRGGGGGGFHPDPGPSHGGGGFHPAPGPGHGGGGFHPAPGPGHIHHDPYPVRGGVYPWPRWDHPYFPRPVYGWNWYELRSVTCTAEDSVGDLFPVTEDGYIGEAYQSQLDNIEDAAIDRCYSETNGDPACHLLDCAPTY